METADRQLRGGEVAGKRRRDVSDPRQLDLYGRVEGGSGDVAGLAHDSGVFASSHGTVLTRCDAHCHSKASSGPAVKALGYIGCPESYSEPEHVFEQARARGMDLVAITDHDTIDGAMSLVERGFPGVVVGEEVTVYFPEDRCKLHVLVWTLTPEQHEMIAALNLREDVYRFAAWLHEENLPHALAHPLYIQNKRLTKGHLDRCALLFKGFETLNGAHSGTHRGALDAYLASLTPGRVHRMIDEVGIQPKWSRVWEKARTGGSDDHGLLNVGRTWTAVRASEKIADGGEFFKAVMHGRGEPGGVAGHSSLLAHQLTTVGARYAAERLIPKTSPTAQYVAKKAMRLVGVEVDAPAKWRVGLHYLKGKVERRFFKKQRRLDPLIEAVKRHVGPVLGKYPDVLARMQAFDGGAGMGKVRAAGSAASEHETFAEFADELYTAVHGALSEGAVRAIKAKDGRSIADHIACYLVLEATQLPYVFSLFHQNKERALVDQVEHESAAPGSGVSVLERPMRVMLFTDTLGDVNGVSRFIRNVAEQARRTGRELTVVTSTRFDVPEAENIINVAPVFATKMPRYEQLEVALPPLVKMLRLADKYQPDVIHCSTPGPVGTVGLIAAKMLRVPVAGVYHTDFPAYIDHLFGDESTTWATTQSMRAFYAGFRAIFTRSEDYVQGLLKLGIERHRIIALKPGIMVEQFQPRFATTGLFARMQGQNVLGPERARRDAAGKGEVGKGEAGEEKIVRVLFAGRVSVEKNLPLLTNVWKEVDRRLSARGVMAELVVAGDGPYRAEMEKALRGTRARFLGFRHGEELSRIYASCDVFAFPSLTDTLGQVVMESQSSGLPVLVTDQGGPKEMVRHGETGFVIATADDADDPASIQAWAQRIEELVLDGAMRERMGRAAHEAMQPYSMEHSFEHYWRVHEAVKHDSLWRRGIAARGEAQERRDLVEFLGRGAGEGEGRSQGVGAHESRVNQGSDQGAAVGGANGRKMSGR